MRLVTAVTESPGAILPADRQHPDGARSSTKAHWAAIRLTTVLGGQHRRHSARIGPDSVSPDIRMKKKG
jgi:hypothetical protein